MKWLVDRNLSPWWYGVLQAQGWDGADGAQVGIASARDREVMVWAIEHQWIVLTHDLDFGAMLAATRATGPSVVQVRTQDVRPQSLARLRHITGTQWGTRWYLDMERLREQALEEPAARTA